MYDKFVIMIFCMDFNYKININLFNLIIFLVFDELRYKYLVVFCMFNKENDLIIFLFFNVVKSKFF